MLSSSIRTYNDETIKETNNDSNHLISDKTNFLKGRGSLLKEDSPNITTKSIKINIKKKRK